ncbi:MAG TPA: MarR family transcriptional regulator [Acidimicrobiales bacterium]|nr:MarR family transcriptional regulator [Acidimicrobiales bacterium]
MPESDQSKEADGGRGVVADGSMGRSPNPALAAAMRNYQVALDVFDDAVANKLGLNRTDFRCVDILDQYQPMTAGALAQATRLTSGAITFALDRLERAGFVRRIRDESDRRRVLVELVPAAQRQAARLHQPMVRDARAAMAKYSPAELAVICDFLVVARDIYENNIPQ